MSSIFSRILAYSPLLFGNQYQAINEHSTNEIIVHQGQAMNIIVPERPLATGSLQLTPTSEVSHFSEWKQDEQRESFELIQKVVHLWKEKGITNYLIYGKESNLTDASRFNWEIVPFESKGFSFWKQFKVLWKVTFGSSATPYIERERIAKDFAKNKDLFTEKSTKQIESIKNIAAKNDAFCNPEVINNQRVFEGKHINLLYNYAPIAIDKKKLHFLLVTKQHRENFSELTEEEYLEAAEIEKKLIKFYNQEGYHTAYLFNKTGSEAGQTVPHWHEHLIFTATKTQDLLGRLMILKNMMFGSTPLSKDELKKRVESLKLDLEPILNPTH